MNRSETEEGRPGYDAAPARRGITRRQAIAGGLAGAGALIAGGAALGLGRGGVPLATGAAPGPVDHVLRPGPATIELGGPTARTWAYDGRLAGPELRLRQGEPVRIRVDNGLPEPTTVHWHGIRLANGMDGVPGLTQDPIAPGESFVYEFTPPDAGTYLYHSHVGLQLDRGLYGALIVEPRREELSYDREAVLVLDDWLDGVGGRTPEGTLRTLRRVGMKRMKGMGGMSGMPGMPGMGGAKGMSGMSATPGSLTAMARDIDDRRADGGDIRHPLFLLNGRTPAAAPAFDARPGDRVRLRIVNAAADTIFAVFAEGHPLTVTHSDGLPVVHRSADAVVVGMGERFDALVDLRAATRVVAVALGKRGHAAALLAPAGSPRRRGAAPRRRERIPGRLVGADSLRAAEAGPRGPARDIDVALGMAPSGYGWTLSTPRDALRAARGERLRMTFRNHTPMPHPMHLHGHSFRVLVPGGSGPVKDTVLVAPMSAVPVELVAANPGRWALHCHNVYHQESGMHTELRVA